MTLSLNKVLRYLAYVLSSIPFAIVSFCFVWHLAYTHLGYKPAIAVPDAGYKVKYQICQEDCIVLRDLHCAEWIDYQRPKLCEFVCDSYLDKDILTHSPAFKAMLRCVYRATSRESVEACKVSCSYMNEL